MKKITTLLLLCATIAYSSAQERTTEKFGDDYLNWYNKDLKNDKIMGTSVDKLYNSVLKDLKPKKTVIVAVIDGGVDVNHEDLQDKIWENKNEIPGNGIDDDNNGYIDDIHGWNFIGGRSGDNVQYENMEITRIVKDKNSEFYNKAKELYDKELNKRESQNKNIEKFSTAFKNAKLFVKDKTGVEINGLEDLKKVHTNNKDVKSAVKWLKKKYKLGVDETIIKEALDYNKPYLDYYLNTKFEPRKIVEDSPADFANRNYGNNNVTGPDAVHGTFVSGIIAANRNNELGINGIAANAKIMALRVVPDGDERDKDIALAIMYAVDNGADIINMSFGKPLSPQKSFVDEAVIYAEKHNVLLIHSAGNEAEDCDVTENFPNAKYLDGTIATNWISVGASGKDLDKTVAGSFSNYGAKTVDIFAPGVDIVSTDTTNTYNKLSGTSFSSPVVSGISALLLTYYPNLTPQQIIDILYESSYIVTKPKKVLLPSESRGKREKVAFSALSKTGGIVNAYNAFLYAKNKYN